MNYGMLRLLADALVSLVFPRACALCGRLVDGLSEGVTCSACWRGSPDVIGYGRCGRCHAPLIINPPTTGTERCRQCEGMTLDLLRFVGPYEGALRTNVLRLKTQRHVCRRLREKIEEGVRGEPVFYRADVVVPVPLHPQRQRERGYNQAEVIARIVARALALPLATDLLQRIKNTVPHRAGMDVTQRAESLSRAFVVISRGEIEDKVVLLVDDICTTGATLNECARVLKEAGARAVYGFAVARALPSHFTASLRDGGQTVPERPRAVCK
ncbi:MAG TPA: ComF family protein [Blastocatellia bacterium]|nr:ComF family protein [Blastocatellia bacterium]